MKKHKLHGIIGVIIIGLSLGIFTFLNVYAENDNQKPGTGKPGEMNTEDVDHNECTNEKLVKKYNFYIEEKDTDSGSKYYIKLNPDKDINSKLGDVEFTLIKISNRNITNGYKMKGKTSKQVVFYNGDFIKETEGMLAGDHEKATVVLETANDPDCGRVSMHTELYQTQTKEIDNQKEEYVEYDLPVSMQNKIDCSKTQTDNLAKAFCNIKAKAEASNHAYKLGSKESITAAGISLDTLKCDYNPFPNASDKNTQTMLGSSGGENKHYKGDYYLERNRQYFYAENERTITPENQYEYHFAPGKTKKESTSCKIKCDESVVVEYGAPVASQAGLCFEYKVKVTSIVNCQMSKKPKGYKKYSGYCTPRPVCTNAYGSYYVTEAGPSEEFDTCIEDCDGGKYTQKCSKKCYNKVYGKQKSGTKNMNVNEVTSLNPLLLADSSTFDFSLDGCIERSKKAGGTYGDYGCYYYNDSGKLSFKKNKNAGVMGWPPGRWYKESGTKNYSSYDPDGKGFFRHDYGSTYCQDICWWTGCKGKYLNPGYAAADAERNQEIYETITAECNAAASCTEKTAEFSIEVDYETNEKTETVSFPFTSLTDHNNKDTIASQHKSDAVNDKKIEGTTILDYAGCYKENKANNWYQTEWSFPGSWMSSKTGEISFVDKTGDAGWYAKKDKFCVPLNAQSVNSKWWNWYMNKISTADSSYMQDEYTDKCGTLIKNATFTKQDLLDESFKWNIRAKTQKFGYFGWKFNINCFYGLNNNPSTPPGEPPENDPCETGLSYRVRTVDNSNLFPATDGSNTNTSVTTNKTGRTPGYNWTEEATIPGTKNSNYATNPSALVGQIQKLGDSIYNDDKYNGAANNPYLDYHFKLTPKTLQAIKNDTKSYTDWDASGFSKEKKNGVITYSSKLFRNGGVLASSSITLKKGTIGCNNDGSGDSCDSFYLMK